MRLLAAILLCLSLPACAGLAPTSAPATFVVVRHAEKVVDGSADPPLSDAGAARAQRLAAMLRAQPLVAAYATAYRRTRQTAASAAQAHGLAVTTYAADEPAPVFAAWLRARHGHGTVLVVGHSNTAPQIAAALCGCAATPLGDGDYGRVYRVRIGADGRASLEEGLLP